MKKTAIALLGLIIMTAAVSAQDAANDLIKRFDEMVIVRNQYGIVQEAAEEGGDQAFYAHALDRLVREFPDIVTPSDKKIADDMAKLLCQKIADGGDPAATGPNLWYVAENFTEPLVRAEAVRTLGKIQATDYLPQVIQLLSDINNAPNQDRLINEQIAFGCVEGLEAYKETDGYLPVFFASTGWYSQRIKDRARKALPNIMENPSDPLTSVIKSSSYGYSVKYSALQVMEESNVTSAQKSTAAVAALAEAWRSATNVQGQRSVLMQTRKLALNMIRKYGTEDTNVYPLIERCYREGADPEEQISAVSTLSALATDDSARRLSSFLFDMNTRRKDDTLTREDERMVRVIIPALGATHKKIGQPALKAVLNNDKWTGAVQRLAMDAMKKLQ
jgi:hypothetical protein